MSNYITIKLRRGTAAQWTATNPVLAEGEVGLETDTRKFKVGTGAAAWNTMQYWGGSGGGAADFVDLGDVPASYAGQAGKFVKVKSTEDGLEFGTLTIAAADLPSGIDAAKIANGSVSNTEFQYLDGVTSPIQTQINNRVPYVGASGDVNLGEHGIQLGNLEFDNTPTNTPATDGSVFWDDGDGVLQMQMKGGTVQKVGIQSYARAYNDNGATLTKGTVVYISGAQGNRVAVKRAQANSESTAKNTIALVAETIASGAEGMILTEGPLYGLNTAGLTAGATLYLSPTTLGGYTATQPQAPDHLVIIGFVERVHASAGSIYVKIANGYELEELHDVDLTESKATPVDADALLLQDSADSSIWKRLTWANLKATAKTYFDTLYAAVVHTHVIGDVTNLQTTLDGKVDENAAITGATKTKVTYDSKGLVTAGADAAIADITGLQTALDAKVTGNAAITGATKTKVTYDSNGLVTAGADAAIADITGLQTALDAKADLAGATFTGLIVSPAAVAGTAGFRIPHGTAPTAPVNGDVWTTTTGLLARINGTTRQYVDFDGTQTINGVKTFSNATQNFGTSTATSTISIGTGATVSGATKTVNVGTGSLAGSTTAITIGSTAGTSTTTLNGTTNGVTRPAATNDLTLATTAFVRQEIDGQPVFTSTLKGLAPASGGGTTNFLRADGTWAAPPSGGSGTVLSPTQITSWQNNYNPTSWGSGVQTLRLDGNSAFNFITGLTATTGGHRVKLLNVGSNPIGMVDASTSSTAGNRFEFGGRDLVLLPGRAIELEYDSTSSRWRAADSINIWAELGEWVNFDRVELYHRNVSNIGAHHLAYLTATGTLAENNGGSGGIRPRIGVVTLGTGTSSSSRAVLVPAAQNYRMYSFHDGTSYVNYHYYETSIRIATLSDAADIFSVKVGWLNSDSASSIDAETNGLFLYYRHNVNSGQWQLRAVNNTTITNGNSTSAIVAATWYRIKVIAYPDGTAAAYVNGTLVATLASGLPGSGQDCAPMVVLRKEGGTTGTTARSIDLDYMGVGTIYNLAR